MRFPWQRRNEQEDPPRETRQAGGDFSDAVVRLIEQTAAGATADTRSTAATEAAAGALSRAFAIATVVFWAALGTAGGLSGVPGASGT